MKLSSKLNSIKRVFADYSLRKFFLHASSPFNWPSLLALHAQTKKEKQQFSTQISQWHGADEPCTGNLHYFFHPWLQAKIHPAPKLVHDEIVSYGASQDPELRMRQDRLGWALEMAIHDQDAAWQTVAKWCGQRWKSGQACRDSYSISERVSNLILLWNIQQPTQSGTVEMLPLMKKDVDYLLHHLEYYGERETNNHILNNARALILAGSFLDNSRYYKAGCWLLDNQLVKHVSGDGVVREASTHYQWVITRWILEVGCAFQLQDQARFHKLRVLFNNMLDVCESMLLGPKTETYLPLIGDISPDFPPHLYRGMTRLGYALLEQGEAVDSMPSVSDGLWPHFFVGRTKIIPKKWQAADKSWVRLANDKWSLLVHSDMHTDDNRVTHGHHDLFSFELAFGGVPVVVDPGRKNYLAGRDQEEAGILDEWHNTILVNGNRTGFIPRGYMPASWLQKIRTRPHVAIEDNSLEIRLDGPREVPGISRITRSLKLDKDNRVAISNKIIKKSSAPAQVTLVMHVLGETCMRDKEITLKTDKVSVVIRWTGLGVPGLRDTFHCIEYGVTEPCTRIEWNEMMLDREWSANIEIIALEGKA